MTNQLTPTQHTQLWTDFRSGSRSAFTKLYELFAADLYRYGYNLVRNKLLVEDCLHELFLHIHEKREQLGPTDNIRFYLYCALRRRLLNIVVRLNKLDSDAHHFDRDEFMIQSYESLLVVEQAADYQKQMILAELNKLPKRQKEVLYLIYLKGLTYQQTAEVMDIALKSVYNTINIALMSLRASVREAD